VGVIDLNDIKAEAARQLRPFTRPQQALTLDCDLGRVQVVPFVLRGLDSVRPQRVFRRIVRTFLKRTLDYFRAHLNVDMPTFVFGIAIDFCAVCPDQHGVFSFDILGETYFGL
jgi:hypothetical protein